MQHVKQNALLKRAGHTLLVLLAAILVFSCKKENSALPSSENAALNETTQSLGKKSTVDVPYSKTIFASCANGGAGEDIELQGKTNFVYQIVWTDHGFNIGYHENTYAVKGIGLSSGDVYVGSGGTEGSVSASWVDDRWVATTIERLRVVGPNANFGLKNTYHITTNPEGVAVVTLDSQEVECK